MKYLIVSILLVLFSASPALSQGLANDLILSKRTVIRDSLGKAVELSDCTDRLNSKQWILHPEKNEQGKILYYLLKRPSSDEKELLSDDKVSSITSEQINKLKRDKFILTSENGKETRICRRGNKQVERTKTNDGSKEKIKYRITWLEDGSYILKPWNKVTEMSKTPRYKVVAVTDSSYTVRVIGKYSLGSKIELNKK